MKPFFLHALALTLTASAAAQFIPAPKPAVFANKPNADRATFGYISVPENRLSGSPRRIRLATIIVKARQQPSLPDPVFYLVGGPGGTATTASSGVYVFEKLNANRDVVFIDPRGAGYSVPLLSIIDRLGVTSKQIVARNRARFLKEGIDLSAYNTTEIAADYEAARIALGYGQINLFANSYGTFVAQELLRRYPASYHAVVMSGNSPAPDPFLPTYLPITSKGFSAFFRDVDRSPIARRGFPRLRQRFYKLVRQLDAEPLEITLPNRDTKRPEKVTISGATLINRMSALLQTTRTIRVIPLMITQFEQRRYNSLVRRFFANRRPGRPSATGAYYSVLGVDFAAPGYRKATALGIQKVKNLNLVRDVGPGIYSLAESVVGWKVPYNPGTTRHLPVSAVPTLLLNGQMDAQTPVDGGATIARGLSRSFNYVYPRIGHAVGFREGPDSAAALAFIDNPAQKPPYRLTGLKVRNFYVRSLPFSRARVLDRWEDDLLDSPLMIEPGSVEADEGPESF